MGKLDVKYRNGYLKYTGTTEGSVLHWRAIKESESKLFSPDLLRKLKFPNQATIETFKKTDAGEELHRVSGINELVKEFKK